MTNNAQKMQDKELLTDLMMSEKLLCSMYQTASVDSATGNIRNQFKNILNEELDMQNTIFSMMSQKGWYPLEDAPQSKVVEIKNTFEPSVKNS